jgi:hypothetical protein
MPIHAADVPALRDLLSEERLAGLVALTGSTEIAIELHQATLQLNAALMNVTGTIEIALRNAVFDNLCQHFGVGNWLQQPPVAFTWKEPERKSITKAVDSAKRAAYSKLTQADKASLDALAYPRGRPANLSHLKRSQERRRQIAITEGKVIAELTLFFWKRVFGPEYEQTLWRPSLKRVFPDKQLKRAALAIQLERLYQSRNRFAHHEPVLHRRFDETMAAIEFIVQRIGQTAPRANSPLANLTADDLADIRAKETALRTRLDAFRQP